MPVTDWPCAFLLGKVEAAQPEATARLLGQ